MDRILHLRGRKHLLRSLNVHLSVCCVSTRLVKGSEVEEEWEKSDSISAQLFPLTSSDGQGNIEVNAVTFKTLSVFNVCSSPPSSPLQPHFYPESKWQLAAAPPSAMPPAPLHPSPVCGQGTLFLLVNLESAVITLGMLHRCSGRRSRVICGQTYFLLHKKKKIPQLFS